MLIVLLPTFNVFNGDYAFGKLLIEMLSIFLSSFDTWLKTNEFAPYFVEFAGGMKITGPWMMLYETALLS